jgi:hypothetical protein
MMVSPTGFAYNSWAAVFVNFILSLIKELFFEPTVQLNALGQGLQRISKLAKQAPFLRHNLKHRTRIKVARYLVTLAEGCFLRLINFKHLLLQITKYEAII